MKDDELWKEIGIEFPKDFVLCQEDWKDFYVTLSAFKYRALWRQGIDPLDIITPTGKIIRNKRSQRGG